MTTNVRRVTSQKREELNARNDYNIQLGIFYLPVSAYEQTADWKFTRKRR
jgi:hypothetical protein